MGAGHSHPLHVHGHSVVHRLPPEVKVAAAFAFAASVAVTPRTAWWAFAVDAAVLAAVARTAAVPARFVVTRLAVVTPFLLVAALTPFVASGERIEIVGLEVSRAGLWGAVNIAAKAVLGGAASILLAATTEIPSILRGLERLRVPPTLVQIAGFMVRYLEVVAREIARMRTAMTARGYDPRWLWQVRPIAASAGAMFVRSYERGERVHAAMLSRGYDGTMPDVGGDARAGVRDWLAAAGPPSVAALMAVAGTVTG